MNTAEEISKIKGLEFRKAKNESIIVSFQTVSPSNGNDTTLQSAQKLPQSNELADLPEPIVFEVEKPYAVNDHIIMRASHFPSKNSPLRIEFGYSAPREGLPAYTPNEAMLLLPKILADKKIITSVDAMDLKKQFEGHFPVAKSRTL